MNKFLQEKQYSPEDIQKAALIFHPQFKKYNIKTKEIKHLFEEGSNFWQLSNPIKDEHWNKFYDSEGYYMAKRTNNLEIKKMISFLSSEYGLTRKSRKLYSLELDKELRIKYMREAIKHKFNNNPKLRKKLLATEDKEIIEYTFWWDMFFGIDQETLRWSNVLGKLLVEYREKYKESNTSCFNKDKTNYIHHNIAKI